MNGGGGGRESSIRFVGAGPLMRRSASPKIRRLPPPGINERVPAGRFVSNERSANESARSRLEESAIRQTTGTKYEMIPTNKPERRYTPGSRVVVTQHVRVGDRRWSTQVGGIVEDEGIRPVGGMEMGGKARYGLQPTLKLRQDDGSLTVVAIDEHTEVRTVEQN
jgi:hypothetical protein